MITSGGTCRLEINAAMSAGTCETASAVFIILAPKST